MKQQREPVDEAVDRVLQQLADARPPVGMEARLIHAVHARTAARTTPRPRRLVWVGLAAAAMLCLLAAGLFTMLHPRSLPKAATATLYRTPAPQLHSPRDVLAVRRMDHPPRVVRVDRALHRASRLPASEAASFPAPPMPLTEQERLLLGVAEQRNPAVVTLLNQHAQDAEMAQNHAAFEAYFYQPTEEEMEKHAQQN